MHGARKQNSSAELLKCRDARRDVLQTGLSQSTAARHILQVWDLESFACVQTLEHEGVPVQLIEIAGTRLHSVAGRTVRHMLRSPPDDIMEHLQWRRRSVPQGRTAS